MLTALCAFGIYREYSAAKVYAEFSNSTPWSKQSFYSGRVIIQALSSLRSINQGDISTRKNLPIATSPYQWAS